MKHIHTLLATALIALCAVLHASAPQARADVTPVSQGSTPAQTEKPADKPADKQDAKKADDKADPKADKKPEGDTPNARKVPKAAVITLGERGDKDMVGLYMTAHQLKTILPMLKEDLGDDGTGIVVFRVTSGGGALSEIQKLSDVIHNEYKKHFRVVGWIDSAISAAAMTSHCIEEIYFTPQGNYGACTGWSGNLVAVKGRGLEEVLYMMEKISARGGYDPKLMRSMQIFDAPLSANVDKDGRVTFYQDDKSGEIVLSHADRILTLNSESAKQIKFSKGTAESLDDLRKLMGYEEINWIGEARKNYIWPISRAEEWSMDYRDKVKKDSDEFQANVTKINMQIEAAAGVPRAERGKFVNRAREILRKIKSAVDNNPNFALFNLNMMPEEFKDWYAEQDKRLRDMMK